MSKGRHALPRSLRAGVIPLLVGLLLAGAALGEDRKKGRKRSREGSLAVFLIPARSAAHVPALHVVAVSAVGDDGATIGLEPKLARLDGLEPGTRQPLASGDVSVGRYAALELTLAWAATGDEPPAPLGEGPVRLPAEFRVGRGDSVTLTIEFAPAVEQNAPVKAGAIREGLRLRRETADVARRLTLYVTNEAEDSVVALNRDDERVFAVIPVGRRPRGIDVTADGQRAFVANAGDDTLSVLDPATHRVADTIPLKPGCRPEDVASSPDRRRLVVSCPGLNLLTILDPQRNAAVAEVSLARSPGRIAVDRSGSAVYALLPEGNQIVRVDLRRPEDGARSAAVDTQPTDLALDRLSGNVYVSHARAPIVSAFDERLNPARQLQTGSFSHGIVAEADGRRLYASGGDAGGLALIGPQVGTVIRRWNTPPAFRIALDPDGRKAFLTGGGAGTLIVVDRIAGRVVRSVPIGKAATDLVVVP